MYVHVWCVCVRACASSKWGWNADHVGTAAEREVSPFPDLLKTLRMAELEG